MIDTGEKKHGYTTYDVSCDFCSDSDEFEAEDWSDLMRLMKEYGWTKQQIKGEWMHKCPDCGGKS